MDDKNIEWLGVLSKEEQVILNAFLYEAYELMDEDLLSYCHRYIRMGTARGGLRAKMVQESGRHDAPRDHADESRVPSFYAVPAPEPANHIEEARARV